MYIVYSFVELTEYLLGLPGVKYVLSEKFCQDPLESFFGKQRMRGGYSDNPNAQMFLKNTVSLRLQGSLAAKPINGNCTPRENALVADNTPLPKRKHSV